MSFQVGLPFTGGGLESSESFPGTRAARRMTRSRSEQVPTARIVLEALKFQSLARPRPVCFNKAPSDVNTTVSGSTTPG